MGAEVIVDNPGSTAPVVPSEPTPAAAMPPVEQPVVNPAQATPQQRKEYLTNLLAGADKPVIEEPVVPPNQAPVTPQPVVEPGVEIPDKFKNADGSVNTDALVKSYLFAEKKISEQGAQVADSAKQEQMIADLQAQIESQAPGQTQAQPAADDTPPALSEEQIAEMKDKFFDSFYENPQEALSNLINSVIENSLTPVLQPILARQQFEQETARWQVEVDTLAAKFPDFGQYKDQITEVLTAKGESFLDTPGALESAYWMAKGMNAKAPEPPKDIDTLLKDPAIVERIKNNPEIQKAILGSYSQQVTGEPKPVVMGAVGGGKPPTLPPVEIKSTKDASRASAAFFSKVFGGG